ncbi:SACE_7040 family transcriptional regulator [Marinitenerispora sediminis]|uniref:TetR family transcriptional regulator n=1 Tax=Marinitenerispora sediminis TaxID=1931232 RepID=A0A368T8B9_9ACTN|nr:TetR/AcrR family transcriptional regulator [Marinitenerispora sediminis]RCV52622.1 TetR family transcriptional regulator [Marinitenerispora sediminis]RCV60341.1 TetR family transcriptional regulator [Marinitenerispora sediminis]RCV60594.1 TetR family transcriptional regulator [Marinitenerispora sediminis]
MASSPARSRRVTILRAAADLFAARGFHGVSIEDLGRAVGTTGPALYRHFPGKEALLAAMLLDVSERLAAGGRARVAAAADPEKALAGLLDGHIAFALDEPALITVHDRELGNVPPDERRRIRRLQRGYLEQWVQVLAELHPAAPTAALRAAVHAAFGLLNSTPHILGDLPREETARLLHTMGRSALLSVRGAGAGAPTDGKGPEHVAPGAAGAPGAAPPPPG